MKKLCFILALLFPFAAFAQHIQVYNLKCEYKENPTAIEARSPRLSWVITSDQYNVLQTAYEVIVADNSSSLNKNIGNIWNSKKLMSSASILVPYSGKALQATKTYFWKVRIWDNKHNVSAWSKPAAWQMGLLTVSDWKGAKWIAYEKLPPSQRIVPAIHGDGPESLGARKDILPIFRKDFTVKRAVKAATLFISGLGQFEASLNGKKIGDHFLDPGWTNYDKEAMYLGFDVTAQLSQGKNTIGVMLGNGMYYIPGERYRKITGAFGYPKLICRLKLQYADGTSEDIVSDQSWKTAAGPITFSSIYGGEDYDARLEQAGWDTPYFNDATWKHVVLIEDSAVLKAQIASPVKVMATITTKKISHPNDSTWVYDLGQNASGIPKIMLSGIKGAIVKITPGELLDDNGLVTQQATGEPSYFCYTLAGNRVETWQPKFSYYGFRYLQVTGAAPRQDRQHGRLPKVLQLVGLHIRNSAEQSGEFSCSKKLFNRTDKLIKWAIKSNMVSLLTDCPHREKLGWLEEDHLMANSIRYNFDLTNLFLQEIENMKLAQRDNGMIPDIAPEYVRFEDGFADSPEWGSSGVLLPWYVYQWYGNPDVLNNSYDMIKRYVDYLRSQAKQNIVDYGLGDWYDIGPNPPGEAQLTPKAVTATAYYYYDLSILSKIAKILGKDNDATKYAEIAKDVRVSYNQKFFDPQTNQYSTASQTANAISVYMGLVEEQHKAAVVDNIVKDVRKHHNAITAGDIGFRYLLKVLADEGRSDVIFDMNSRTDVPGYGYQLAHGATSLTESWQAYRFVSNNHFMLGHLMEWFYNDLAGISQDDNVAGSQKIIIQPTPVGDVTFAEARWASPYGEILSSWQKTNNRFVLKVAIPVNTSAKIYLPATASSKIYLGDKLINGVKGVTAEKNKNGKTLIELGSGEYHFVVKKN